MSEQNGIPLGYDLAPDMPVGGAAALCGWLVSEKFDGVRGLFDGNIMRTRRGNVIRVPDWWRVQLKFTGIGMGIGGVRVGGPGGEGREGLDGEIYLPGGTHRDVTAMIRRGPDDPRWNDARYMVFDAPGDGTLADRTEGLAMLFDGVERAEAFGVTECGFIRRVEQDWIVSVAALRSRLVRVLGSGGEGVVARHPGAAYASGRTWQFIKIKRLDQLEEPCDRQQPSSSSGCSSS